MNVHLTNTSLARLFGFPLCGRDRQSRRGWRRWLGWPAELLSAKPAVLSTLSAVVDKLDGGSQWSTLKSWGGESVVEPPLDCRSHDEKADYSDKNERRWQIRLELLEKVYFNTRKIELYTLCVHHNVTGHPPTEIDHLCLMFMVFPYGGSTYRLSLQTPSAL